MGLISVYGRRDSALPGGGRAWGAYATPDPFQHVVIGRCLLLPVDAEPA